MNLSLLNSLTVVSYSQLIAGGIAQRCAVGKQGFVPEVDKREGDLKTPIGRYGLRELWVRTDKVGELPKLALPVKRITPTDGWCDAPGNPSYNRHVALPYAASHERLWREDDAYDLIIPLGYNDDPPVDGRGSAIFLHVAQPDFRGTEGCVALAKEELLALLPRLGPQTTLIIDPKNP